MTTQFDSNTFEHDYIVVTLLHLAKELKTEKDEDEVIDKYAVALTAFMTGQIRSKVFDAVRTLNKP